MHSLLIVMGAAFILIGGFCLMMANYEAVALREELNLQVPESEKITSIFWHIGTWIKLDKLQARYDPHNPRRRREKIFTGIGFVLFFLGILTLGSSLGK